MAGSGRELTDQRRKQHDLIMHAKKSLPAAALGAALLCCSLTSTQAGNVFRADTSSTLNLAAAWSNSVAPTSTDIATWDQTVQVNTTSSLGASLTWAGMALLNPGGPITIAADGNTLNLGASGIDLSQ